MDFKSDRLVTVDGWRTTAHADRGRRSAIPAGSSWRRSRISPSGRGWTAWNAPSGTSVRAPRTELRDDPKALLTRPRGPGHGPTFNERMLAFAAYWGFQPRGLPPLSRPHQGRCWIVCVGYRSSTTPSPAERSSRLRGSRPPSATLAAVRWPMSGSCEPWANPPAIASNGMTRTPDPGGST